MAGRRLSTTTTRLVNAALYQAGWFTCVLGAAAGRDTVAAAAAAGLVAVHLALSDAPRRDAAELAAALGVGLVAESAQIVLGSYERLGTAPPTWPPPIWLLVLWAQFATTFRAGLRPIMSRVGVAALFGACGGPLAFLAGHALGAVVLSRPLASTLAGLAAGWAMALALLSALTRPGASMAARYRRW
ncbi:MAG: DUF2878 domain-containing protein [Vicinamibacterales bacterium]